MIRLVLTLLLLSATASAQIRVSALAPVRLSWADRFQDTQELLLSPGTEYVLPDSLPFVSVQKDELRTVLLLSARSSYLIDSSLYARTGDPALTYLANTGNRVKEAVPLAARGPWGFFQGEYLIGMDYLSWSFDRRYRELASRRQKRLALPGVAETCWKDHYTSQYFLGLFSHSGKDFPADSLAAWSAYFRQDDLLPIPEYREAAISCLRQLATHGTFSPERAYQIANTRFEGHTRDFLLFSVLKSLLIPHFAKFPNPAYNPALARKLPFERDCHDDEYVAYIRHMLFPSSGTAENVLSSDHRTLAWKDILAKHRGKTIYVDFWAGWCGPCRAEMPFSRQLNKKRSDWVTVYISLDDNFNEWKKTSALLGLPVENSYLLPGSFRSKLAQKWNVRELPRYILIGPSGQVQVLRAKRPGELLGLPAN